MSKQTAGCGGPKKKGPARGPRPAAGPDLSRIAEALRPLAAPCDGPVLDPANARRRPGPNLEAIEGSPAVYGQRKPIVINRRTRTVIAGNGTLEAARERFRGYVACGVGEVREHDLRRGFPAVAPAPSVVPSAPTLQFLPIEYRQALLRGACRALTPGGCLASVEKVLGATADLDAAMTALHREYKAAHGYSPDEIDRKRLSLEGVLVPVTARWNENLLAAAGFRVMDCFWRWTNFAAWVAVKG
jgi:hypothetical protein